MVKKETFKVGEWVVREESTYNGMKIGDVDKIIDIKDNGKTLDLMKYSQGHSHVYFRKALSHEIPKQYAQQNVLETLELW